MSTSIRKNINMLYLMNIAKFIFPMLTLPYLTRVLSTDCYGVICYLKAIISYASLFLDFGFMLSATKEIALNWNNNKSISLIVSKTICSKILLFVLIFVCVIIATLYLPILKGYFLYSMISILVVFLSVFLCDYFYRGIEQMQFITTRFVLMKFISTILTFFCVHSDGDVIWIPILDVLSSAIAVSLTLYDMKRRGVSFYLVEIKLVMKWIKNATVYFVSNIIGTFISTFNTIVVGICFSPTDVAYWSLAMQIIGVIQSFYGAIMDGIYPYMIKNRDVKLLKNFVVKYGCLVIAGCVFSWLVAPFAIEIVAGTKYLPAVSIFRLLIPVLFFSYFSMLFGWPALGALGKAKEVTTATMITAGFQLLGIGLLVISSRFSVVALCLLRDATEIVLSGTRLMYLKKYIINEV